jgi:extracellular elastinolytic metalloproteinase
VEWTAADDMLANFATPPDGTAPLMRMYVWIQSAIARDGSLSNDVIAHEQTHGTTNRMTGVSAPIFEKGGNE